eukprot:GSChrysophyteH1.ASY1.ANO1.198.1 assembled CDS
MFEFRGWNVGTRYRLESLAGKGSYGSVAIATDRRDSKKVAIKKIQHVFSSAIGSKRILRELRVLRHLRGHPNILLVGTSFVHSANIVHRDLKPANVLLRTDCTLKICDFGLARVIPTGTDAAATENVLMTRRYSTHVVTRWYRAPELILGNVKYTAAVDSCPTRRGHALFPGTSCALLSPSKDAVSYTDQRDQLTLICSVLGRPDADAIETMVAEPDAIDLLSKMLRFDHTKRITVDEALKHPYLAPLQREIPSRNVCPRLSSIDMPRTRNTPSARTAMSEIRDALRREIRSCNDT